MTLDAIEKGRRSGAGLWQLHHRGGELCHFGVHHFHDGQANQPPEERCPATTTCRTRPDAEDVLLLREIRDNLKR
jgi:hypothetical protein